MQKLVKITILALILCCSVLSIQAQKYGHLNLGNLLEQLPEVKEAETQLQTFQEQLMAKGQGMLEVLQAKAQKLQTEYESLAPVVVKERQEALKQEEQNLLKFEQEVRLKVQQKREELLGPILQKVQDTIQSVAQAEGYMMIFDTSLYNAILFAKDSEDVLAKVKAKL